MQNNPNRNYGPKGSTPQQQNYDSQISRDNRQAKNAKNARANTQHSPENGRDSNVPNSASGSHTVNQVDIEIGKRLEHQDAENTNTVPNPGERIANPEEVNDPNMEHAIDRARDHNLQGSSRKHLDDFDHYDL